MSGSSTWLTELHGSFIAFLIALGLKHNSPQRKVLHILLCATVFFICQRFLFVGQLHLSLCITIMYILMMMIWTLYVRYPLYCTYVNILNGFNADYLPKLDEIKTNLVLKPYSPKWKTEFLQEQSRTRALLLPKWKHILHPELSPNGFVHVGSTAIANIALAKPQHDCVLALTCDQLPEEFRADLSSLGYSYIGVAPHSLDCADHFFFFIPNAEDVEKLGDGFYLHVLTPKVHPWLRVSKAFCDYLSENEDVREIYSNLKKQIASNEKHVGKCISSIRRFE